MAYQDSRYPDQDHGMNFKSDDEFALQTRDIDFLIHVRQVFFYSHFSECYLPSDKFRTLFLIRCVYLFICTCIYVAV